MLWQALLLLHWPLTFCWPQMLVSQAADFIEDELVRARKSRGALACARTVARHTRDSHIKKRIEIPQLECWFTAMQKELSFSAAAARARRQR